MCRRCSQGWSSQGRLPTLIKELWEAVTQKLNAGSLQNSNDAGILVLKCEAWPCSITAKLASYRAFVPVIIAETFKRPRYDLSNSQGLNLQLAVQ